MKSCTWLTRTSRTTENRCSPRANLQTRGPPRKPRVGTDPPGKRLPDTRSTDPPSLSALTAKLRGLTTPSVWQRCQRNHATRATPLATSPYPDRGHSSGDCTTTTVQICLHS